MDWKKVLADRAADGDEASRAALEVIGEAELMLSELHDEKAMQIIADDLRTKANQALVICCRGLLDAEPYLRQLRAIQEWREKYPVFALELTRLDAVIAIFEKVRPALDGFTQVAQDNEAYNFRRTEIAQV